jgi:peptide/nickel transport system substrate-binding protein
VGAGNVGWARRALPLSVLCATRAVLVVLALCLTAYADAADLVIGLSADVTSIDPHVLNAAPNNAVADQIFGTLVMNDARQRQVPGLAESWRTVDETTWEFKLRRGVKFHDGSEFSADDVVFTLDRPFALKSAGAQFAVFTRAVREKIVVDAYTIRLKTATPYPNLPVDMSALPIVSKRAADGAQSPDFDSGKAAVGAGPYKLVRFVRGDRIELVRNEAYWGPKPAWERVTLRLLTNDASRVAALLAGDVHLIEAVPTPDIGRLKANPNLQVYATPSNRMIFLHLDSAREKSPFIFDRSGKALEKNPFRDVRVRKAVSKAINRQAIVQRVMEGAALPAGQFVPEGFFGYNAQLKPEPFDPEGARLLLAEAGYPGGFAVTLHGPNNRYVNDDQIVQAVAQMLVRVGIQTKVETMPLAVYFPRANKTEFSFALLGWGVSTGEASYPLRALVGTFNADKGFGNFNWARYSNPRLDRLIEQALATVDDAQREKLLRDAQQLAFEDQAVVPLHYQVNVWAARKGYRYVPRTDERTHAHAVLPE